MAKYLITGGCGFIGSHLARALVQKGHFVRIFDDFSIEEPDLPSNTELIKGSILDKKILPKAFEDVEGCFHLAGVTSIKDSIENWQKTHLINVGGTLCLLEYLKNENLKIPFIYASSAAVYGDVKVPSKETDTPSPLSPYGVDKLTIEHQARVAWELFKIPTLGFRIFNVYGPRKGSPKDVISIFLKKALANEPISIFGDGLQQRDFIYIDDVVEVLIQSISFKSYGEVLNLCSKESVSLLSLLKNIEQIIQKNITKNFYKSSFGNVQFSIGDNAKLLQYYHQSFIDLKTGLKKCIKSLT